MDYLVFHTWFSDAIPVQKDYSKTIDNDKSGVKKFLKLAGNQQDKFFNELNLYDHIEQFSFPRLCGTQGERDAVNLVDHTFRRIGFEANRIHNQNFEFSDFYSKNLIKFFIILNLIFILIISLVSFMDMVVMITLSGIVTIILVSLISSLREKNNPRFWGEYFGYKISATNVFVKVPALRTPEGKSGNLVISTHLDTKSQSFKALWRIITYNFWLFSTIAFVILILLKTFHNHSISTLLPLDKFNFTYIDIIILSVVIIIILSNCILLVLHTENSSPGALDNASGMAIVFELSRYFKDNPLNDFNLWFVLFSAEELGTMGSRMFLKDNESLFKKNPFFQLNFDMVSCMPSKHNYLEFIQSYGIVYRSKQTQIFKNCLNKAAEFEDIPLKLLKPPLGAHTDSVPFRSKGFDAIDIVTIGASRYIHGKKDTLDKVDRFVLRKACILTQQTLILIDNIVPSLS